MDRTCTQCDAPLSGAAAKRYCSSACKARANSRVKCATCDDLVWTGGRSALSPRCRSCRAPKCGELAMYEKRGCRCDECRAAKAAAMREYVAERAARGEPVYLSRRTEVRSCAHCGEPFDARVDTPGHTFCSPECANLAQGWDPSAAPRSRFRISAAARRAIYERDGWVCQICLVPVEQAAPHGSRESATLDHIVPRSRGGSDEFSNLRLAHMGCNAARGAPEPVV